MLRPYDPQSLKYVLSDPLQKKKKKLSTPGLEGMGGDIVIKINLSFYKHIL